MSDDEYVSRREKLIPEAETYADRETLRSLGPVPVLRAETRAAVSRWNARWAGVFAERMQLLAYRAQLISYDPTDSRLVEAKRRRSADGVE